MSTPCDASLLLLQLSFLLLISTAFADGDSSSQSHSPPVAAPQPSPLNPTPPSSPSPEVNSPPYPPSTPPSYTPPVPRNFVAIQGVVYCKSCKYVGVDTLTGAAPLSGAVVKLQCDNTKHHSEEKAKTDKNGFFFFMPHKVTTSGSNKCKVFLVSSPLSTCNSPTNLNGGTSGATLKATKPATAAGDKKPPFKLFTVGPLAFEPIKKLPCN